jgi:hypothetical protein
MNDAIAKLPWTDRQWDLVQQAVKQEAERTRVPAKSLRAAKADPTDVAVPAYALGTTNLPLSANPLANTALGAIPGVGQPQRTDVNSNPTVYLTTLSKLVYVRNREVADGDLEAVLTYFRRAGAEIARAENALLLNGRRLGGGPAAAAPNPPIPGVAADIIVNRIPGTGPVRGLYAPAGVVGQASPPIVGIRPPTAAAIAIAGAPAAAGGEVTAAVSRATAQLENAAYHGPFAMVVSSSRWAEINQPSAQSLVPARPAIERILLGGPLMHSDLLQPGAALVFPHDCPELEQVVARDINVKFLHASEEPRFVFRVSVRTALRVRDRNAIAVLL